MIGQIAFETTGVQLVQCVLKVVKLGLRDQWVVNVGVCMEPASGEWNSLISSTHMCVKVKSCKITDNIPVQSYF